MHAEIVQALKHAKERQSAHHVNVGDRTVAFRYDDHGRFNVTYNDGEGFRKITPGEAIELATAYLSPPPVKPATPPKRTSIPLGKGWSVSLRRDEVYPNDPGAGMPATLCGPFGKSASLWSAVDMGVVMDRDGCEVDIPESVAAKLDKACEQANDYIEEVTAWLNTKSVD